MIYNIFMLIAAIIAVMSAVYIIAFLVLFLGVTYIFEKYREDKK